MTTLGLTSDNDDIHVKGGTDETVIGNISDSLKVNATNFPATDTAPANQTITAVDSGTSNLTGANGQVFYFGTATTNSSAVYTLSSIDHVSIQANILGSGGTLVVETSMDNGSFWLRPNVFQISTQSYTNGFTAPFIATVNVTGMTTIRIRAITSWSGVATIILRGSLNSREVTIADALPAGANTIGGVSQNGTWNINNISGTVSLPTGASTAANQTTANTTLAAIDAGIPAALGQTTMANSMPVTLASDQAALPVSQSGSWSVTSTDSGLSAITYSAATLASTLPLLATDIFTITGSATKTIRIQMVSVEFTGSANIVGVNFIKRSSANTGGTATTLTDVPHDSNSAAATATIKVYTVNPTVLGTTVGIIRSDRASSNVLSGSNPAIPSFFKFGTNNDQPIVLRGTAETLSINLNGVTVASGVMTCWVEWTES